VVRDAARIFAGIASLGLFMPPALPQQIEQGVAIVSESIASRVDGFSYKPDSSSELGYRGTALAPRASGSARVKTSDSLTEIAARFEDLPPPEGFGPFTVYVLWVVTPEGRAFNVGAINLDSGKGRLTATTPFSSFAMIVTAEPHFAVSIPGETIVLQNIADNVQGTQMVVTSLAARADYRTLVPIKTDPKLKVPVELTMAHYAVTLAENAEAATLAPKTLAVARAALSEADNAQVAKSSSVRGQVPELARQAIQAAEDARAAAQTRQVGARVQALQAQVAERDTRIRELGLAAERDKQVAERDRQADKQAAERDKQLAAEEAALLRTQLEASAAELKVVRQRLPNSANRLQLAAQLLNRWLVFDVGDKNLTVRITSDSFANGKAELGADARNRLSTAAGILSGIGNVTVTVTPALQFSEDVRQLGLSQQRARGIMEWLASLGLRAQAGVPNEASAALEKALAPGPGVELLVSFDEPTNLPPAGN
jgi:outer membrane protein OmpA-like peptidoglycan-associated protein